MKARRVKGLDRAASFRENAERMVRARIAELWSFGPRALDPDELEALHDMRIAAKRLRYLLEISEPCFGAPAREGAKVARSLQDLLGEIHDCDVMAPRVRAHADRLRGADVQAVFDAAAQDAADLDPAALTAAASGPRYRGLETLATFLEARRRVLHRELVRRWADLQEDDFRGQLERALEQAA